MPAKIRVLIVDDEPLARDRVRALAAEQPDLEVAGECADGQEALEAIDSLRPDLVFLDIQMPGMDGLEMVGHLERNTMPAIVFVTAYDQFAIQAFELHALDYLLKPFDDERFAAAIDRVRTWLGRAAPAEDLSVRLEALLSDLRPAGRLPDRLAIKSSGRVLLLRVEEIDWVEAADNYVNLHVGTESHLLRETMNAIEKRLSPDRFLRISRSTLVNLDRIKELQPLFHGEYAVILRDGTRVTLSRGYRDKLTRLLGKE
jgi:two-component system, LytTR family, response regulator